MSTSCDFTTSPLAPPTFVPSIAAPGTMPTPPTLRRPSRSRTSRIGGSGLEGTIVMVSGGAPSVTVSPVSQTPSPGLVSSASPVELTTTPSMASWTALAIRNEMALRSGWAFVSINAARSVHSGAASSGGGAAGSPNPVNNCRSSSDSMTKRLRNARRRFCSLFATFALRIVPSPSLPGRQEDKEALFRTAGATKRSSG